MSKSCYEIGSLVTSTRTIDVHSAIRCGVRGLRRTVSALGLPSERPLVGGIGDCTSRANQRDVFADTSVVLARLRHPQFVAVEDFSETGGRHWAVVGALEGAPLAAELGVPASRARPLALERATSLVLSLAEAVHALSTALGGAALGGVSADSVWILPDGSPSLLPTVRLAPPAGLMPVLDEALARYRAPESLKGAPLEPSADVYALALLFWDLVALGRARQPEQLNGPTSAVPVRIDQGLVQLVMRSLSAVPSDRPPSALEFRAELSGLLARLRDLDGEPPTVELGTVEILPVAAPEAPALPVSSAVRVVPKARLSPPIPVLSVMPPPVRAAGDPARVTDVREGHRGPPRRLRAVPILAVGARPKQLRIVEGDGSAPSLFLRGPARRWVVGRARSADLVVCDPDVSREHFEVVEAGGTFRLYDLGSKNGVFVNGAPADQHALRPGDEVRAGATLLRFEP